MAKTPELNSQKLYQRNYLINGNLDFWQRNTTFSAIGAEAYTADRWIAGRTTGSATSNITRSTDIPSNTSASFSINVEVATAQSSFASSDRYGFQQKIEGNIFKTLKNSSATLSFWVKGSTVGTYSVGFYNEAADRTWVSTYTISSANTWEKKTININFKSATGTWNFSTGVGLGVYFALGSGTGSQTSSLNTWVTGSALVVASTQVNMMATAGNYIRFSQVQLIEGDSEIPFRTAGTNINEELSLCQRYYERSETTANNTSFFGTVGSAGTVGTGLWIFKSVKRAAPSFTNSGVTLSLRNVGVVTPTVLAANNGTSALNIDITFGVAQTVGTGFVQAAGFLAAEAEL